ncbi:FAD dependent oxidoreductase [Sulfitobacter brevis]|uniref:FAD dependent oxidoreductase n=1 Tax=Sulfitobacter brevis TaxID=74348 RepID=A0A1I2F5Y0_9RHOB|nr:FAD-dependent oxidoreductase [Sulfitobacter brevis]SFE99940.1 FAD dependent oxidoreductase [Sulfitobacter brevis]
MTSRIINANQRRLDCDVAVIGGGTAGFGAAIAAARAGLSVRLVEAGPKVGGVMAFCPGMPWGGGYPQGRTIGGIFSELTDRLAQMTPPAAEVRACALENFGLEVLYDHEAATLVMLEMLSEAGVILHLNSFALNPNMQGDLIASIDCADRRGTFTLVPKMVIDCSGDGDISAKSGVPFSLGDAQGNMMAVTLSFHMIGADCEKVFAGADPYFQQLAAQGIADGLLHPDLHKLYLMQGFQANSVFCNTVTIRGVDGTDSDAVTRATQEGRRRCHQVARFLVDRVSGFETAQMWAVGPTVGVRETRKLEAVYRITGEDIAIGTKFADGIVACDNPIDDVMRDTAEMTHDAAVQQGDYYTIPFRSLIPRKIANLLFAGRLISADPVAFASVRGMPQCIAMGQACGVAVSLAVEKGCSMQILDTTEVTAVLAEQGVWVK